MRKLTDYISTAAFASRLAATIAALLVLLLATEVVRADHSLGRSCISCHTLRSTNVVQNSRNVLITQVVDPLYKSPEWYCASDWTSSAADQPLPCVYCHQNDIGEEFTLAYGGKFNTTAGVGSSHPVESEANNYTFDSSVRITCNDCHNGPTPGTPKLTPASLCTKTDTDGYPNHIDAVVSPTIQPGDNDLENNRPWLTGPYGPEPDGPKPGYFPSTPPANWAKATPFVATDVLCFICHDGSDATDPPFSPDIDESKMVNIMGEYNVTGGGHNVAGIGSGVGGVSNKKMPCYDCHDPHSGVESTSRANKALIIPVSPGSGIIVNPYEPGVAEAESFTFGGYKDTNADDRGLCLTCHASGSTVKIEGTKPVSLQNPINGANLKFGFHANAHATAIASGNCLQASGGCHQSPHNTSPFDCLGCHSHGMPSFAGLPSNLKRVANVDSEFDGIGSITNVGILSQHNVPYNKSGDLSTFADNGCLACHNVAGTVSGMKVGLPDGTTFAPPAMNNRESLSAYNNFCTGCHDGSTAADERFSGMYPPRVEKYFTKGGHGTGFATGVHFESGNTDAKIPCLECHMYHGSTAYKLLPGNVQTKTGVGPTDDYSDQSPTDIGARVVKGFDYTTLTETTATAFTIGGVPDSRSIDYTDYTLDTNNSRLVNSDRRSRKYANYTTGAPWNTYYEAVNNNTMPTDPAGVAVQYGTTGDMVDTTKLGCSDLAPNAGAQEIGFCNTCHLHDDKTDGADKTFGWVYTHESMPSGNDCDSAPFPTNPNDLLRTPAQQFKFFKDCTECHDVHGSGATSSDNPNWYMVRGKVTTGYQTTEDTYNVIFDDPETNGIFMGQDSGDEIDSDNKDDICAVCHTSVLHNTRTNPIPGEHYPGDCFICHPHGKP